MTGITHCAINSHSETSHSRDTEACDGNIHTMYTSHLFWMTFHNDDEELQVNILFTC